MDKIQFQIDQLRKDKIIYATESVATSIAVLISVSLLSFVGSTLAYFYIGGFIAIGYWLYAMIGNFFRLQKIRKLESQL